MPGHVQRVVHDQVDLLGAEHHARDAAEEAEHDQRQEHAGERRVVPGALRSHSKTPWVKPFLRWAASIAPGTVMPWIRLPSTARYMA